ncbi:hypothetical protein CGRA01v4_03092 [Colletotrichum graminicola]|nr:hypothetical protein CGRA01v4_03092 [Colletotrichum graminicola]
MLLLYRCQTKLTAHIQIADSGLVRDNTHTHALSLSPCFIRP